MENSLCLIELLLLVVLSRCRYGHWCTNRLALLSKYIKYLWAISRQHSNPMETRRKWEMFFILLFFFFRRLRAKRIVASRALCPHHEQYLFIHPFFMWYYVIFFRRFVKIKIYFATWLDKWSVCVCVCTRLFYLFLSVPFFLCCSRCYMSQMEKLGTCYGKCKNHLNI